MTIEYAIFQGGRCVGVNLTASSVKEINQTIADLNVGDVKFRAHITKIKAGV
jgi:hypothetical protein